MRGGVARRGAGQWLVGVEGDGVDRATVTHVLQKKTRALNAPHTCCAICEGRWSVCEGGERGREGGGIAGG